jgi:cell pole-organizing protein PopZ
MIQRWMDNHLPKLVESVLKEELGRAMVKSLGRSA